MHASDWIARYGTHLRSIGAGVLRRKLRRRKGRCTWCNEWVVSPRRRWCSNECVEDFKLRCNRRAIRRALLKRDGGVCSICGVDTVARRRKRLKGRTRWQADHIIPVSRGGGLCGLDNYRTLCVPCHKEVTAEFHATMKTTRKK